MHMSRELTGLQTFTVALEPVGGELAPEDFEVVENNDVLRIVSPQQQAMDSSTESVKPLSGLAASVEAALAASRSGEHKPITISPTASSLVSPGTPRAVSAASSTPMLASHPPLTQFSSSSLVTPASSAQQMTKGKEELSDEVSAGESSATTGASYKQNREGTFKKPIVRLPTRIDLQEGGGETGLYVAIMGVFWLSHQGELNDVLRNVPVKKRSVLTLMERSSTPIRLPIENPRLIRCGHNMAAVIDAEGGLWMCGPQELPVACFGTDASSLVVLPDQSTRMGRVALDLPTRMVSCGSYCTVAEAEGGQLFSWGIDANLCTTGLNGAEVGARISRKVFVEGGLLGRPVGAVEDPLPGRIMRTRRCASISCSATHTCVTTEDEGENVFLWGSNEEAQLGTASTTPYSTRPLSLRIIAGSVRSVKSVACGSHHTVAVMDNGHVFAWGWNKHGELGRSTPTVSAMAMEVTGLPSVLSVSCGESHTLALSVNNETWSWGSNRYGELGRPDGNYLPGMVKDFSSGFGRSLERLVQVEASGYSSGVLSATGVVYVWGFFKGANFASHQMTARQLVVPGTYVSQFSLGLTHVGLCCDEILGNVLELIDRHNGLPPDEDYKLIASLMARARGDVLHHVQNRGLGLLARELPCIKCNVAYLVTNTQLLIVNFSQVLVSSLSSFAVNVRINIPQPKEVPQGCAIKVEPEEFSLEPDETVTLNVTVNVSKSVTENVTTLMEMIVTKKAKRRFLRRKMSSSDATKYFLVLAFPYTPMLNGRVGDTSAYLIARFCSEGDVAAIKNLLDRGSEEESTLDLVNSRDYEGRTPLFVAAQSGHLNVVRLLVARGANVNTPDVQDQTPLSAAFSNGHEAVVQFLSSVGGSLDVRRLGVSEQELAFLRAANKLYIGARKQDLTALDEEDLLSLQAALLQNMKTKATSHIESDKFYKTEAPATNVDPPQVLEQLKTGTPKRAIPERALPEDVAAWNASSSWAAAGFGWVLRRPDVGDWSTQLHLVLEACQLLPYASVWSTGALLRKCADECVAMFWERNSGGEAGEWVLHVVGRARDGKAFGGMGMAGMVVEDVLLRVWGNQMFDGIASVPAPAPLGAWESFFLCPECMLPDPFSAFGSILAATRLPYDVVEMSVALGHALLRCSQSHRVPINRVAPTLLLEHLSSMRLGEEQLKVRLMIQTRVGAGGFSHIYKGTLRPAAEEEAGAQDRIVAVKQYIQRKPIMFSFDTPEERAAKEQEQDQGAMVVFRRLHHEVQMLALKHFVSYETENAESKKDMERLLRVELFSLKPPYVITEYYEMGDVYRVLHNNFTFPSLDEIWLIGVAVDIARGMRFLHQAVPPLVHRDLKTPNVYIVSMSPNAPRRAVVGDLGTLVPMFQRHRTDAAPVTNPIWMAPELIQRKPYNTSVDVYSFGIIMWELATREHPFTDLGSDSLVDDKPLLRAAIANGQRPAIPEPCIFGQEYAELMVRCWDEDPAKRPSFNDVVVALVKIKNTLVSLRSSAIASM